MNRGDIYWCNFEPAIGSEIRKLRPAILISNDISNRFINVVQVIPLTSNITNIYPSECLIKTPEKMAKALGSQITTLYKSRITGFMGKITSKELKALEKVLMLQLGLQK